MKKLIYYLLTLLIILSFTGCGRTENHAAEKPSESIIDNTVYDIDTSSVQHIDKTGCVPVSTDSIKEILTATGRFEVSEIPNLNGVDVFLWLDKNDGESIANISFTESDDAATEMVSYNFSKDTLHSSSEGSVRWGLDALLQVFGDRLTDETWNSITSIADSNENVGAFGTDYEGYSNSETGIMLTYADLGDHVQIDIEPIT